MNVDFLRNLRCYGLTAVAATTLCASAALAVPPAPGEVVISEVWGGVTTSGFSGAPKADYVELFNRTGVPQDLTGCTLSIATTSTSSTWAHLTFASGTVPPFGYFLVRVSADGTASGSLDIPTPDAAFATLSGSHLGTSSGKAVLRSVGTTFTGTCPTIDGTIIDLLGWGTTAASCREGGSQPGNASTSSPFNTPNRNAGGCADTNVNGADFTLSPPTPNNSSVSTGGCVVGACCNNTTGACAINTAVGCSASGGTYVSDASTCPNVACPAAGACCSATSTCTAPRTAAVCATLPNGFYIGDNTTCSPTPCTPTVSCCFASGVCCALFQGACIAQGGNQGTSTTCTATSGNCTSVVPSNDLICNAITVTLGTTYVSNNFLATSTNDGATVPHEATRATKGIWYRYTPTATSVFTASACGSGFDQLLEVIRVGDCNSQSTWSHVAGDDDKCLGDATEPGQCAANGSGSSSIVTGVALEVGNTYYFRVSLYGTSATGGGNTQFRLTDIGGAFGACCIGTSLQCELRSEAACIANGDSAAANGVYQGDSTTCTSSLCGVKGACCLSGGICVTRAAASCTGTSLYQGDDTTCYPEPCITEACCNNTSGACTLRTLTTCQATETGQGADTVCSPSPCPAQGACCNTDCTNACTTTIQTACNSPDVWHTGTTCSPTNICTTFATAPANDEACNAVALTLGIPATGTVAGASTTNDGPDSTCQAASGRGVWYTFQPTTTGYHSVSTCGATFDDVLTVMTGACNDTINMLPVACDDDTCTGGTTDPVVCGTASSSTVAAIIPFVYLESTTNYFVRVQALGATTVGGTFPLVVNTVAAGACCSNTGACAADLAANCTATTETYQGDGTTCTSNPCPPGGSCCNNCTYACTTTLEANCNTTTSTWTSSVLGGTCTAPNTCITAPPAPTNDLPCSAIALASLVPQSGTLFGATSTDDGPQSTCDATATKGVWFKFTPGVGQGGDYTIGTCGSTFANNVTVLTGDCNDAANMAIVACDDDTCIGGATGEPVVCGTGTSSTTAAIIPAMTLTEGVTYYIRVQVDGTGTGAGTFSVSVLPAFVGACCTGTACTDTIAGLCTGGALFFSGQTCAGGGCNNVGSCCSTTSFACALAQSSSCTAADQIFTAGSTCALGNPCIANDLCPGPALALATMVNGTTTGATPGAGTSPSCSISGCEDTWWDFTAPFADIFNFHVIQLSNGQPSIALYPDCSLTGELTGCEPHGTTPSTACCYNGGRDSPADNDIVLSYSMTAGQHIKVRITSYACIDGPYTLEVTSTQPSGACCTGATCAIQLQSACASGFQGVDSLCSPNPCAPPGVCCRGATCTTTLTSAAACSGSLAGALAGSAFPTAAGCNGVSTVNPCCYPDYNKVGGITVGDIFDFLNDWFAGRKFALLGGDGDNGTLAVQNIFDFLNAWFAGGC